MDLRLEEVGAKEDCMYVLYDYFSEEVSVVSALSMNTFVMQRRKFYYHIVAPIESGIAFLGDRSKHVTCSRQLIKNVAFTEFGVTVQVYSKRRVQEISQSEASDRHSESNALKKQKKRESEATSTWIFYCQIKPKAVFFDGKSIDVCWKDAILKVREELFESQQVKDWQEIEVII